MGAATEHLYQLNHVYVTLPTKEASIKTKDDRLFTRLDIWDATKKTTVVFEAKPCCDRHLRIRMPIQQALPRIPTDCLDDAWSYVVAVAVAFTPYLDMNLLGKFLQVVRARAKFTNIPKPS